MKLEHPKDTCSKAWNLDGIVICHDACTDDGVIYFCAYCDKELQNPMPQANDGENE